MNKMKKQKPFCIRFRDENGVFKTIETEEIFVGGVMSEEEMCNDFSREIERQRQKQLMKDIKNEKNI